MSLLPFAGTGGGTFDGIAGIETLFTGVPFAGVALAPCCGSGTRALQVAHVTNLAPTGTSDSAMRATVPQAAQVASIIQRASYPGPAEVAGSWQLPR